MNETVQERLRAIPSVDRLLALPEIQALMAEAPRLQVRQALDRVLDRLRGAILQGETLPDEDLAEWVVSELRVALRHEAQAALSPLINATGVLLHTNLGRALLAPEARGAVAEVASRYVPLEYELESGSRGRRTAHVSTLLCQLTGAEAAHVVNNNAAAVILVLHTLARDRPAIISRGELVEIGGGFRMPEVMAASGAVMVEVGTTNRTRLADYRKALTERTALLVKVHRSNFRLEGFVEEAALSELVALGREYGVPILHDLGSGLIIDLKAYGLSGEPTVGASLEAGADLVAFSGDKLFGGPQAGILAGRADLIDQLRSAPLARAFRLDKLTLAALEATLRLYLSGEAEFRIPILKMLTTPVRMLKARAEALADSLRGLAAEVEVREEPAEIGGGAFPGTPLPSVQVGVRPHRMGPGALARVCRMADPPLVGRVHEGAFLLDLRTVLPEEEAILVKILQDILV